jgi:tetratricopeptide (TPR) repeat protein
MIAAKKSTICALLAISISLLQGCAGSQTKDANAALAGTVGKDNLDLLFATEFPVASKQEAITKSNIAHRDRDIDKALFYSVKALEFDVTDVDVLVRIAHLHVMQGNSRMAARSFNLALAQEPSHSESLQGLGLLYFEAGEQVKARQHLERAVAGNNGLWRSYNVLGVLADERGDHALAAQNYEMALKIQPGSISVLINQGYSRFLAGEFDQAARDLYNVAISSNHPKAWRNLGMVYARRAWYDDALETFLKVDDEAVAYNRAGLFALDNKDLDVAFDYFSAALRHSPVYFAEAEQNLARTRQQQGLLSANR